MSGRQRNIKEADEVAAVLIPKGVFSLVGLSLGGWLASQYAIQFPERVHKTVLISPAQTVLPVSLVMLLGALLTILPLPGFRRQFYYWLLHDTVESGEGDELTLTRRLQIGQWPSVVLNPSLWSRQQ